MNSLELKIPPMLMLSLIAALMWSVSQLVPAAEFHLPARRLIALGFAVIGVGVAIAGVVSFRMAKTTVNPVKPQDASMLVVSGVYRFTRNPMYLGSLFLLIGWGAFLANFAAVVLVPSLVLYLNRFQIGPEERALTSLFPEFSIYRAKVRRWL